MVRSRLFLILLLMQSDIVFAAQAVQLSEVIDIVDLLKQPQRKLDIATLSEVVDVVQSLKDQFIPVVARFKKIPNFVREETVIDGVPVYRLQVLEQSNAAGGAWACGFHSLKNVLYLLQALQINPMTAPVAQQLQQQLNSKNFFEQLFLNGGNLGSPEFQSWLYIVRKFSSYKANDGIFAGDTALLLQKIVSKDALLPAGVDSKLLERVYPIDSFFIENQKLDNNEPNNLLEFMGKLSSNQWPAVAFILPPAAVEQHAIGIVLHRTDSPVGLEVFVLNSLNSSLNVCKPHIQELVAWYQISALPV